MGKRHHQVFILIFLALALLIGCDDKSTPSDDAGPRWIDVDGGSFLMGCANVDMTCAEDEIPPRIVTLSPFQMLATEVTLLQYLSVANENPSKFSDCSRCPVEGVSWFDADAFCRAVGGRLPTEAEWEYVARAGSTMTWPCGEDPACLDAVAWDAGNAMGATHPVAEKDTNPWGFSDLLGNVFEWTADWYAPLAEQSGIEDPSGPEYGEWRVLKGGSWFVGQPFHLRPSFRGYGVGLTPDYVASHVGFRCVRQPSE